MTINDDISRISTMLREVGAVRVADSQWETLPGVVRDVLDPGSITHGALNEHDDFEQVDGNGRLAILHLTDEGIFVGWFLDSDGDGVWEVADGSWAASWDQLTEGTNA